MLKKENGCYVDTRDNKWECKYFSEEQALMYSNNCNNCYDCINCNGCDDCINCNDCYYCKKCLCCKGCINCNNYCINCNGCYLCNNCNNCYDCKMCYKCIDCYKCYSYNNKKSDLLYAYTLKDFINNNISNFNNDTIIKIICDKEIVVTSVKNIKNGTHIIKYFLNFKITYTSVKVGCYELYLHKPTNS